MRQKEWIGWENILLDLGVTLKWWQIMPQQKGLWCVSNVVSHRQEYLLIANNFIWPFCTHTIGLSGTTTHYVFVYAVIVILLVLIGLFIKAFQLFYEPKSYICNWVNLLVNLFEVSLYILSIIFVSVFWTPCMCPQEWQWQIGLIAVFLAWINLNRFFAKFPSTGIYVIMFGKIVLTFLKVIILSLLLLITFAITFHMTFSEEQFQVSHLQKEPTTQATFVYVFLLQHCVNINWSSIGN